MTWLLAIVALGFLIVVHEAGHYFVARWCKMRVERFSIRHGHGGVYPHGSPAAPGGCQLAGPATVGPLFAGHAYQKPIFNRRQILPTGSLRFVSIFKASDPAAARQKRFILFSH